MATEFSDSVSDINRMIARWDRVRERFAGVLNEEQLRQFDSSQALRLAAFDEMRRESRER